MSKLASLFPTFPTPNAEGDKIVDEMLTMMKWWKIGKIELDNLTVPEYIIMRDYASKSMQKEQKEYDKIKRQR